MTRKSPRTALAIALFCALCSPARAATIQLGVLNLTTPSTGGSCPITQSFAPPVAPGTTICTFSVQPSGWVGTISNPSGGADSGKFVTTAVGGTSVLQVGASALTATGSAAGNASYQLGSVTTSP
jgi:hypothetical protein